MSLDDGFVKLSSDVGKFAIYKNKHTAYGCVPFICNYSAFVPSNVMLFRL